MKHFISASERLKIARNGFIWLMEEDNLVGYGLNWSIIQSQNIDLLEEVLGELWVIQAILIT